MSLENPFSKKLILPPEETNPDSNVELIGALLGADSAEAYRKTIAGETSRPVTQKPEFDVDTFDKETFNTQEIENRLNLTKQYETQRNIFEKIGLLETKEGILGMTDIEGVWHNFPTLQEISQRLIEKQALVETKVNQGFEKLLIVPFSMSLKRFVETMKKTILAHHSKKTLWSKNQDGTMEALKLDTKTPLYVWDQYQKADTKNTIVYFPTSFVQENHGGKTKKQLLQSNQVFHILLLESKRDIPSEGEGEEQGGRQRLEANKTANEYLKQLQTDEMYQGEQGVTPEDWMTLFLIELETTNQMIDDYRGTGKASYNLGGWLPASNGVACGSWYRDDAQARLDGPAPRYHDSNFGVRSAVMV